MTISFTPNANDIYFRLDHGIGIGDGHLFRSKALALELQEIGFRPVFITRQRSGFDPEKFKPFLTVQLTALASEPSYELGHEHWLGTSEKTDAEETLTCLGLQRDAIFIVDHYGISVTWEKLLSQRGHQIAVIDDLFRRHRADLIIDYNITADLARYAQANTREKCNYLMGPGYSMLRKDIALAPVYQDRRAGESYLLALGSAHEDVFYKMLGALREFNFRQLSLLNPPKCFRSKVNETGIDFCLDLPGLYLQQQLVFGSCGVANVERMALAVPTVSSVIADNQIDVGKKLEQLDLMPHLGDVRELAMEEIKFKIQQILNSDRRAILARAVASSKLIARNGIQKIALAIKELPRLKP